MSGQPVLAKSYRNCCRCLSCLNTPPGTCTCVLIYLHIQIPNDVSVCVSVLLYPCEICMCWAALVAQLVENHVPRTHSIAGSTRVLPEAAHILWIWLSWMSFVLCCIALRVLWFKYFTYIHVHIRRPRPGVQVIHVLLYTCSLQIWVADL